MQFGKLLLIGAGLSALINVGTAGAAEALQSLDSNPAVKPSHKAKPSGKSSADSPKEMTAQLQALRDQVDALQRRLDAQNAAEQQTKATADEAAAQAASANTEAATATAAAQAIPAEVKTAIEAATPKTDRIYYKGVTLTLGGFGALESVYRTRNEAADMASTFSGIPFNNSSVGQTSEFRFSARQSRITALVQGDVNPDTHLAFYGELDFLGAAQTANSNETNSYTPRIRVLYNQVDWDHSGLHLLAGQNWSLVTLQAKGITPRNEVIPPTIDAQYIPGFSFTRQPQIRLTKDFGTTWALAVSLENPQTTSYTSPTAYPAGVHLTSSAPGGSGFDSANTLSLNHIPDAVVKLAFDPTIADRTLHFEVFGLYRSFYERLDFANRNVNGGGVGAGLIVPLVPQFLDFQLSGMGGKGIGRYGAAQLTDVTFDAAGNIKPVSEIQALAGLTLHASPKWDIYAFAGEEKESAQDYFLTSSAGVVSPYGYGNPLYDNSGCASETAAGSCVGNTRVVEQGTAGFWYKPFIGKYGRYQIGLQYSYTERKAFNGNGAQNVAPIANDSMVFASFRYYPF
jgi:multidrug efflux pump subunit AcrA (membrane-fusion protein)